MRLWSARRILDFYKAFNFQYLYNHDFWPPLFKRYLKYQISQLLQDYIAPLNLSLLQVGTRSSATRKMTQRRAAEGHVWSVTCLVFFCLNAFGIPPRCVNDCSMNRNLGRTMHCQKGGQSISTCYWSSCHDRGMGSKFKVSLVRRCKKHEQASVLHSTEYLECMIITVEATWYSTISTGRKFQSTSKKGTSATSCFRLHLGSLSNVPPAQGCMNWKKLELSPVTCETRGKPRAPEQNSPVSYILEILNCRWCFNDWQKRGERSIATIGIIELSGSIGKLSCSPDPSNLQE